MFLLVQARSFTLPTTETITGVRWLREVSDALFPDALAALAPEDPGAGINQLLLGLVLAALWGTWLLALRHSAVRPERFRLRSVLLATLLFSLPLIWLPKIFSDDVYLYMSYGRTISEYGQNPILVAPSEFPADPYLPRVAYKDLPSAYGPLWLILSGGLSAAAGDGLVLNVLTYRTAGLLLHLLTAAVVWTLLRRVAPERAAWGVLFYAWNPLVLVESVGSAHNDVMMALLVASSLLAAAYQRWLSAVFLLTAAMMVKITAVLLIPPLVLFWIGGLPDLRSRLRGMAAAGCVVVVGALALYAPLWGGTALLRNIGMNPAATEYYNTFWAFLASKLASASGRSEEAVRGGLGLVRNSAFLLAYLFLLWRAWKGREISRGWAWIWLAYLLSVAWIWPWYFVLAVLLAAVGSSGRITAVAVGLTLGGLLFSAVWPPLPLRVSQWLTGYRFAVLFAPALALLAWTSVRAHLPPVFGPRTREAAGEG